MARNLITLITRDHRELERMFHPLGREPEKRERLVREVAARFVAHGNAAEEYLYPVAEHEAGEVEGVRGCAAEHHKAEEILERLSATDCGSPLFDDRLHELVDVVRRHVRQEEDEILPALAKVVSTERLEELGAAFDRMRQEEVRRILSAGKAPLTREELYEQAEKMGIEGRSHMNREELAESLQRRK
ncbi:hemerythrin domain-containing protein [Nocardiopsis mangrovi]|uniref:Hemerythrin domain-containing protein n=1 Tax=Nocardiopsis mangrovi TaxID=1179818 RepID=A0ABV9DU95_9ACTN